jgi:hypothetical protein
MLSNSLLNNNRMQSDKLLRSTTPACRGGHQAYIKILSVT